MYKYDPKKYFLFLKCEGAIILRMIGAKNLALKKNIIFLQEYVQK